ncbi:hypothetical protein ES708_33631 [subsurface metagenome]
MRDVPVLVALLQDAVHISTLIQVKTPVTDVEVVAYAAVRVACRAGEHGFLSP